MAFSADGLQSAGSTSVHDRSDWFGLLTRHIDNKGYEALSLAGPKNEYFEKKRETWEFLSRGRMEFVLDFLQRIQRAAYSVCEKDDIVKDKKVSSLLQYSITREYNGFDWPELLSDDPSLIDCCDVGKMDIDDLVKILLAHPTLIKECDQDTKKSIGGKRWARLAAESDVLLNAGSGWMDWGALVAINPERLEVAKDHLQKNDWVTIVRAHSELRARCPEALLRDVKQMLKAEAAEEKQAKRNSVAKSSSASSGKTKGLLKKYWMPTLAVLLILSAFDEGGVASFVIGAGLGAFWWWKRRKR